MPRAFCSWQLRHSPFICVSCRLRLSSAPSHLPSSRSSSTWSRNASPWNRAVKLSRPTRQLSASAPLHDAADNAGVAKPRRALGAFAKSSGGVGAFANKGIGSMASADKLRGSSPSNAPPVFNDLLPHELAARETMVRSSIPAPTPTPKSQSQDASRRSGPPVTRSNFDRGPYRPGMRTSRPAASGDTLRRDPQPRSSPSQSWTGDRQQSLAQGTPSAGSNARTVGGRQQQQQPLEGRQSAVQTTKSWVNGIDRTMPSAAVGGQPSPAKRARSEDQAPSSWQLKKTLSSSQKLDSRAIGEQITRSDTQAPSSGKAERTRPAAQTLNSRAVDGQQPPIKRTWSDAKTPDSWAVEIDKTLSTAPVQPSSTGDEERPTEKTPQAASKSMLETGGKQQQMAQKKPLAAPRPRRMGAFSQLKASSTGSADLDDSFMPWKVGWDALQIKAQNSQAVKKSTGPENAQEPKTTPASVEKPASNDPNKLNDFWHQFNKRVSGQTGVRQKPVQQNEMRSGETRQTSEQQHDEVHNDRRGAGERQDDGRPTEERPTEERPTEERQGGTPQTAEQQKLEWLQEKQLHEERIRDRNKHKIEDKGQRSPSRLESAQEARMKASSKKQKKPRRRSLASDDEDYDDYAIERYEARQKLKAEQGASQQQAEEAPPVKKMFVPEFINLHDLAKALKLPVDRFLQDLGRMGFENLTSDTIMTGETAGLVAAEYNYEVTINTGVKKDLSNRPPAQDVSSLPSRPPVVTIMGHVDHGKTTLLDRLRKSSVAAQEHGGITQHIGAFVVKMSSGKLITFLDTPGHAAFLSMRQRGAYVTDMVVLVVAADDSVMPQTLEALKHAENAKVPIIVAVNKVDKPQARIDQVMRDLASHGVQLEEFGGDVQAVRVSGKTGEGMEELEESIVVQSEFLELRTETDGMAEGWVIESSVKPTGKSATVLIKRGTLRPGDIIVAGKSWARVRLLLNEAGTEMAEAPPGTPAEVLGWRELPPAGELVLQAPDEETAKTAVEYRLEMADRAESSLQLAEHEQRLREQAAKKEAEEEAAAAAAEAAELGIEPPPPTAPSEPGVQYQNFIIRADVVGSVEAVSGIVLELGNNEVRPRVLRSSVGQISEFDVDQAATSGAMIINFNSPILPQIRQRAASAQVRILEHNIIYRIADDVTSVLEELLTPLVSHRVLCEVEVLQIFPINVKRRIVRNIAGCRVRNGVLSKTSKVKVLRRGEVIFDGLINTFRQGKKEVQSMSKGSECGIGLQDFDAFQVDDQIQGYEVITEKRTLGGRRT